MTTYTTRKQATIKPVKSEAEKAEAREKAAIKKYGARAYETKPFNLLS